MVKEFMLKEGINNKGGLIMATTENNKLIAEFMGYTILQYSGNNNPVYNIPVRKEDQPGIGYVPEFMKYHKSWDWLMLVVEKIENIADDNLPHLSFSKNNFCVLIGTYNSLITSGDLMGDLPMFNKHSGSKIEATYKAVVEFIQWYNENKED